MVDLSKVVTPNPTMNLQEAYQRLLQIQDPDQLVREALEVAAKDGSVSEKNFGKFARNLAAAKEGGVARVQGYITNFILAGCGLRVI